MAILSMTAGEKEASAVGNWRPSADWPALRLRAALLRQTRCFFEQRGFLEVETPLLSADTVVDKHLEPIPVGAISRTANGPFWLQTSPELAMKRLLAAGGEAIYQITRAFRGGEQGRLHNPEFTILEWYRSGDTMEDGIALVSDLCQALLETEPADRINYQEAFLKYAKIDPLTAQSGHLAQLATAEGLAVPAELGDDRDDWLDLVMLELVMPQLGITRPVILYDYPASQAALAKIRPGSPPVAERFELFFRGVELANGYHELLDPDELRLRAIETNRQRAAMGKVQLPVENRMLEAMRAGLPRCTGVALGFDRLVMLAAGRAELAQVMAFTASRA
jgi:lysyl-tRNA synthetase class 2